MGVTSRLDTAEAAELDQLMREFPDWGHDHPDIYSTINPTRYNAIPMNVWKVKNTNTLPEEIIYSIWSQAAIQL